MKHSTDRADPDHPLGPAYGGPAHRRLPPAAVPSWVELKPEGRRRRIDAYINVRGV